ISETLSFEYNNKGQLIRSIEVDGGTTYIATISYSNDKPISITKSIGGSLTFTYNNDLIINRSGIEDNILFTHEYTYNSSKQMISDKQYDDGIFCCENTFAYSTSGNISKRNGSTTYEYDDKNNPLKAALPVELLRIDDYPNNNNILKINSETRFSYEYNEKGYPIKRYTYYNNQILATKDYEYDSI